MFVSDLRHFLDIADDAPGPARKMADHLESVVRAATAGDADLPWVSALRCRRRPGRRPCEGRIAVFRSDPADRIEWKCTACGDDGVISGWQDSPFDLRQHRLSQVTDPRHDVVVSDEIAATLRDLRLLDSDCERLVYAMSWSEEGVVLTASGDDVEELLGFVAAEANHESHRPRRRRLDEAYAALNATLPTLDSVATSPSATSARVQASSMSGKWRILEMDLWDREALDLLGPAFIEFQPDGTGSFGFIAVHGWIDWRPAATATSAVEFSWEGSDEGDQVTGRGWAAIQGDGSVDGHIYFHLGDDSGFRAERYGQLTAT